MVRIRFRRVGARNQPSFRIVAADKDSPRDGRFLEVLGSYNPRTNPSTLKVDEARLFHWMSHGAQPSDSVVQTLQSVGTWDRWERFKGGEDIEKLTAEADSAMPDVDPRTRRDDLAGQRSTKRRKHADAEPKAEAKPAEAAEEGEEEPAEEAVEADAEAEAAVDVDSSAEAEDDGGAEAEGEGGAEAADESGAAAEAEDGAEAADEGGAEAKAEGADETDAEAGDDAEAEEAESAESEEAEAEDAAEAEEEPSEGEASEDESE